MRHKSGKFAQRLGRISRKLSDIFKKQETYINRIFYTLGAVIDQTNFSQPRLAQIQFIVRKPESSNPNH